MLKEHRSALSTLEQAGWTVKLRSQPHLKASVIDIHFHWVQPEVIVFLCEIDTVADRDERTWFLSMADYSGTSGSAFAWNEWEKLSLGAAETPDQARKVSQFWSEHLPVLFSVKYGYRYIAVRKMDSRLVCGREPEFEQTEVIASSFTELLCQVGKPDSNFERWM